MRTPTGQFFSVSLFLTPIRLVRVCQAPLSSPPYLSPFLVMKILVFPAPFSPPVTMMFRFGGTHKPLLSQRSCGRLPNFPPLPPFSPLLAWAANLDNAFSSPHPPSFVCVLLSPPLPFLEMSLPGPVMSSISSSLRSSEALFPSPFF